MYYTSEVKKVIKQFKKNKSYSKEGIQFNIENYEKFESKKNDKTVLDNIVNIIKNDEKRCDAVAKIFNECCKVDFVPYFDDISGTKYVDINIHSDIPLATENGLSRISWLITKEKNKFCLDFSDEDVLQYITRKEYTLEHFVGVFHNRQLSSHEDSATRLAKLILYLSGNYSLAYEHCDIVPEEKYEKLVLTKPLASKIDTLMEIFNECCRLNCPNGFADRLGLITHIQAEGEVPSDIDDFVKQKLCEYEKEDKEIADNSERISLIEKPLKNSTEKEMTELYDELVK